MLTKSNRTRTGLKKLTTWKKREQTTDAGAEALIAEDDGIQDPAADAVMTLQGQEVTQGDAAIAQDQVTLAVKEPTAQDREAIHGGELDLQDLTVKHHIQATVELPETRNGEDL